MTAQFSDHAKYRDKYYSIAGKSGTGLFDPKSYGMKPIGKWSACWRGFVCGYAVTDGTLTLDTLYVCLDAPPHVLFGVSPNPDESGIKLFDAIYEGLNHRLAYTGRLMLADDFIDELYVHMGFHSAGSIAKSKNWCSARGH